MIDQPRPFIRSWESREARRYGTVDPDDLARDERSGGGRQKRNHFCDLLGIRRPSERMQSPYGCPHVVRALGKSNRLPQHRGVHRAWRDAIDSHAVGRGVDRHRVDETDQSMFRR